MKRKRNYQIKENFLDSVNEPELDYDIPIKPQTVYTSHLEELKEICEGHLVDKLYIFGSAVSGKLKEESDIDFLVRFKEFDLANYFENFLDLKNSLEILFNRKVDLLEEQAMKNPVLIQSIDKSKKLVYG